MTPALRSSFIRGQAELHYKVRACPCFRKGKKGGDGRVGKERKDADF